MSEETSRRPDATEFSNLVSGRASRALSEAAELPPFTIKASREVQASVNQYIEELMAESARNAHRRTRGESITSEDVEFAARIIASGMRTRTGAWAAVFGGLLAGSGIGNGLALLSGQGSDSTLGVVVTVIALVLGAALTAWDLARRRA